MKVLDLYQRLIGEYVRDQDLQQKLLLDLELALGSVHKKPPRLIALRGSPTLEEMGFSQLDPEHLPSNIGDIVFERGWYAIGGIQPATGNMGQGTIDSVQGRSLLYLLEHLGLPVSLQQAASDLRERFGAHYSSVSPALSTAVRDVQEYSRVFGVQVLQHRPKVYQLFVREAA